MLNIELNIKSNLVAQGPLDLIERHQGDHVMHRDTGIQMPIGEAGRTAVFRKGELVGVLRIDPIAGLVL